MFDLIKIEGNLNPNLQIQDYDYCYKLVKDNQAVGFGTINKDKENALFIFIDKNQRGNGYGKVLFSKMLEETKNIGYNEAKIKFESDNIPMLKIATENGAKHLSTDGKEVRYVIPLV